MHVVVLYPGGAGMAAGEGKIPLWRVLTRWDAEGSTRHAAPERHLGQGGHRSSSSARRRSLTAALRIVSADARGQDLALPGLLRQFRLGG
jgi:hypothetical protein